MNIRTIIFAASALTCLTASAAQFYREPSKIPAGAEIHSPFLSGVTCAGKGDTPIGVTKRVEKNGNISFEVQSDAPEYEPMGKFKKGSPSKHSSVQKAMNEYTGKIPAFICIPAKGFVGPD